MYEVQEVDGAFKSESDRDEHRAARRGRDSKTTPVAAEGAAERLMANTAPTPKAVALVLLPALVLMLAFAFFYVGAFHDPTPHHVPVAVVGPPAVAVQLSRLPGDPLDARQVSSRADALSQIDDREVYGAYEAATNRLFVASAANRATAIALEQTFDRVAAAQGRPAVRVTDVKPLPPKDPNGTAAFYAVIAWVFGGYIGATLIGLIGSPRSTQQAARGSADRSARGVCASSPGSSAWSCCARASGCSRATWSRCARSRH